MSNLVKYIVSKTYKPLVGKYISSPRKYSYKNIHLEITPEVFHPGFFVSTKLLLNYLSHLPLDNKTLLELGAGSGLISIYAAKNGATVTATDINPASIRVLQINSQINDVHIEIIRSDLFSDIPSQQFDLIAINPPYYKKNPLTPADHAWYCGENGEYFHDLFEGLGSYMHKESKAFMILCDGCDIKMVEDFAEKNYFRMKCVFNKKNLIERNFIYQLEKRNG